MWYMNNKPTISSTILTKTSRVKSSTAQNGLDKIDTDSVKSTNAFKTNQSEYRLDNSLVSSLQDQYNGKDTVNLEDIGVMFEKYRMKVGENNNIAYRHIMELIKESPIHNDIYKAFSEAIWLELCAVSVKKRGQHVLPREAFTYLQMLMTENIQDARQALLVSICTKYNVIEHYNLNYIHTVHHFF